MGITLQHWIMLILGSVLMMGNYYCYDTPGSINVPLQKWLGSDYKTFQWQLNMLYSAHSLPNIFIPIVGGVLVDRVGATLMLVIFAGLVCIGQTIFSIGLTAKSFPLLVLGRFLFGLGGESLEVAMARITTDWFNGRGLAFALGINLTFARLSTALNDNVSPWIEEISSAPYAGWVGFGVCTASFCASLLIIRLDRPDSRRRAGVAVSASQRRDEAGERERVQALVMQREVERQVEVEMERERARERRAAEWERSKRANLNKNMAYDDDEDDDDDNDDYEVLNETRPLLLKADDDVEGRSHFVPSSVLSTSSSSSSYHSVATTKSIIPPIAPTQTILTTIIANQSIKPTTSISSNNSVVMGKGGGGGEGRVIGVLDNGRVTVSEEPDLENGYESEEFDEEDETVHFSQIWSLGSSFWLLGLSCIALYGSAVPFFHVCTDFFQQKWGMSPQEAGFIMSIPDFISAVGSPLSGIFLDIYGHRGTFLPIASLFLAASHLTMYLSSITPAIGMSLIGLAYSLFASALWPCVPYLVGPHQIATGYGVMSVALNLSLFTFPLIVARVQSYAKGSDGGDKFGAVMCFFVMMSCVAALVSGFLVVVDRVWGGGVLDGRSGAGEKVVVAKAAEAQEADDGEAEDSSGACIGDGGREGEGKEDEGDDDCDGNELVYKVVGDGVVVATKHTVIHHHHHHPIAIQAKTTAAGTVSVSISKSPSVGVGLTTSTTCPSSTATVVGRGGKGGNNTQYSASLSPSSSLLSPNTHIRTQKQKSLSSPSSPSFTRSMLSPPATGSIAIRPSLEILIEGSGNSRSVILSHQAEEGSASFLIPQDININRSTNTSPVTQLRQQEQKQQHHHHHHQHQNHHHEHSCTCANGFVSPNKRSPRSKALSSAPQSPALATTEGSSGSGGGVNEEETDVDGRTHTDDDGDFQRRSSSLTRGHIRARGSSKSPIRRIHLPSLQ